MSVKFSIVIPVYNASKYLKECIDSVLQQTYDNYEVLLINDGSTDDSYEICKLYEKNNDCIKVFTKENEGLSATRNMGIALCTGDYIVFLDSDDYIEKESLFKFNQIIETTSAEVVSAYAYHFDSSGNKKKSRPFLNAEAHVQSGRDFFRKSLYQNNLRACAPFYITKVDLIKNNNLQFKVGLLHEDELWTPILLSVTNKIVDLRYYFYNYRISNSDSITRDPKKREKRALDRIKISMELGKYFDKYGGKEFDCFQDNIAAQYMYAIYDGNFANNKNSINRFFPLKHAKTPIYIVKSLIFAFSPKLACKLRNYKK